MGRTKSAGGNNRQSEYRSPAAITKFHGDHHREQRATHLERRRRGRGRRAPLTECSAHGSHATGAGAGRRRLSLLAE